MRPCGLTSVRTAFSYVISLHTFDRLDCAATAMIYIDVLCIFATSGRVFESCSAADLTKTCTVRSRSQAQGVALLRSCHAEM